jgi:DNA-binding response OmpR family regulator
MHVVLIDDDEDLGFATSLALKAGGYTPVTYPDCDAATNGLVTRAFRPSAILVDVHLGAGMALADFLAWLRAHALSEVPVFLVSGSLEVADLARSLGAAGYLRKPFQLGELFDRLASVTGQAS